MTHARYCRRGARCGRSHLTSTDGTSSSWLSKAESKAHVASAAELMQLHFSTLLANPQRWRSLISDEIVWERPYAASLGKSTEIFGKARAIEHVTRFVGIFTSFQFLDVEILNGLDRNHAVACALARGQIKSTGRVYEQEFVVFLKSSKGRIDYLREYFDPLRMPWALAMGEANS